MLMQQVKGCCQREQGGQWHAQGGCRYSAATATCWLAGLPLVCIVLHGQRVPHTHDRWPPGQRVCWRARAR